MEGQKGGRESQGSGDKKKKAARHQCSELCDKGSVMLDSEIRTKSHFHHHNIDPNHNLIHCLSKR